MASNTIGITDQDGQTSDWLEIQNIGDSAGNLQNHYLTDDRSDLEQWAFPNAPLAAGGFIRVFASGKNRAIAGQELHTNFALNRDGGFLALVGPNGSTTVHAYDPYPAQLDNVSFGMIAQASTEELVTTGANVKWHVPANGSLGTSWTAAEFDDASWIGNSLVPTRTLLVTEVATGMPSSSNNEYFEIQNVSGQTLNTAGWVVAINDNTTSINSVKSQRWNLPASFSPGQIGYRTDEPGDPNQLGGGINWGSGANGRGWVMIVDDEGQIVDVVFWGWTSAEIGAMSVTINGLPITQQRIAAAWTGNGEPAAGSQNNSLQRAGAVDNNSASEWSWPGSQNRGAQNGGLVVPFPSTNQTARTGVGYERGSGYSQFIGANTDAAMFGINPSAYMRIPFDVDLEDGQSVDFERLELRLRYDDGLVAYINGVEVARRGAPGSSGTQPAFNAAATTAREGATELLTETIDVSQHLGLIQPSGNVLAIHGLNFAANDSDFLVLPELVGIKATVIAENYFTTPTPGAINVAGTLGFVADTKFSVDRGFFETPFQLAITTETPGAEIRYTLDGTPPTATSGLVYSAPIAINTTTMVRAAAFKPGMTPTNVDTQSYIKLSDVIRQSGAGLPPFANWGHLGPDWAIDQDLVGSGRPYADTIINDLKSVPTLSLVMPWNDWFGSGGQGIYISGAGSERAVSAELINGDGSSGFQINAAVEIQGGSSDDRWKDDKLSMQLKFKSAYGPAELDYDLFGGDAITRFDTLILDSVLNFSWLHHQDGSQRENAKYIQDQFVADLQLATGGAAPHGRFVHLYLNGLYWGMYYIHERPDENFAAAYLGGEDENYDIIKHRSTTVVAGSSTNYQQLLNLAAQNLAVDANYQALLNKLDIVPFIDYMIINFYAGNTDWAHHNWYASFNRVDPAAKWHFHSWDAEHVLKHHLATTDSTGKNDAGSPTYIHQRLATNPEYRLLFADRVHKHFANHGAMTPANAAAAYQARMTEIDRAIVGESVRWGDNFNNGNDPYTRDTDWLPDNQSVLTGYFPTRTNVVRNQLLARGLYTSVAPPSFNQHGGTISPPFQLTMSGTGVIHYTTDGSDPRLPGGAVSPTAQVYSAGITLNSSLLVKARSLSGGNWSALTEALFLLPTQPLRIVEVNYAPVDPPAGSVHQAGDYEFVELLNTGTSAINLNGFQIASGITCTFGNQTLAAGQRIVVAKNVAAFQSRYGNNINLANGAFTGSLNNAGEELTLLGTFGETIQSFAYDNSNGWPGRADAKGSTLEIVAALSDPTSPDNWRNSTEYNGTPGTAGVGPIDSIVVNEVLTHTDPPLVDSIELHNPTAAAINIGGWYLSDTDNNLKKYRIPDGTTVPAGGYLVFDQTQFGAGSTGFGLDSASGDDVYLTSATAAGALQNFIDHVDFPAAANGESFGRWPNAAGKLYPMQSRTLGVVNSGPRIGPVVISEIMYNPQAVNDDLEFAELTNITSQPINLNGWKFDEGIDFTFGNVTIQPQSTLVVVRFDPAKPANAALVTNFRTVYGISAAVPLVGGYGNVTGGGVLDNGGEEIRLVRPDAPQPGGFVPYLLVDEVDFDDVAPWPNTPDGGGPSLTRTSTLIYGHEPTNWIGAAASPGTAVITPQLDTITGTSGGDTFHVVRSGSQLHIFQNTPPVGQPTYSIALASLSGTLTINALDGDDSLIVNTGGQPSLGLTQLIYNASAGANSLVLENGSARIDSSVAAGGALNTTLATGAQLTTNRLKQNGLTVGAGSRVTLLPGGAGANVLTPLDLGTTGTLDLADNDLVVKTTAAGKTGAFNALYSRLVAGFAGGAWNGTGVLSSAAQTNPNTTLSLVDNAVLGFSTFGDEPVDANSLLLKYTYFGDIDQNGQVDADDLTVFANNFGRLSGATQVDGDIDFNGTVDADDLTVFANNFLREVGTPLVSGGEVGGEWSSLSSFPSSAWERTTAKLPVESLWVERRFSGTGELAASLIAPTKQSFGAAGSQTEFAKQDVGDESLVDLLAQAIADDVIAASDEPVSDSRLAMTRRARLSASIWSQMW
jgi:hypothetical protein